MRCTKCKVDKLETEFNFKIKSKNIRQSKCRDCTKDYRKEYYNDNKNDALIYAIKSNLKIRKRNRQYIWNYLKNHPCIDCGEDNPIVLEFDHRDDVTKIINISSMVNNQSSINNIKKEIDKCDVRCANCHRIRTSIQLEWYKDVNK